MKIIISPTNLAYFLLMLAVVCTSCSKPKQVVAEEAKLPETYGLYIHEGDSIISLESTADNLDKIYACGANPAILLHDKRIANLGVSPDKLVSIERKRFIRYRFTVFTQGGSRNPVEWKLEEEGRFGNFAVGIQMAAKPVHGQNEMVEIIPTKPLPSGLYNIVWDGQKYPIFIDSSADKLKTPEGGAVDVWNDKTIAEQSGDPMKEGRNAILGTLNAISGDSGSSSDGEHYSTKKLDDYMASDLVKAFDAYFGSGKLATCSKIALLYNRFHENSDNALGKRLASGYCEKARFYSNLADQAECALVYSERALAVDPSNAEAIGIKKASSQNMARWINDRREERCKWEKSAHDESKVLANYTCISFPTNKFTLTSTTLIQDEPVSGLSKRNISKLWLPELGKIEKETSYSYAVLKRTPIYGVAVFKNVNGGQSLFARWSFRTEKERDAAVSLLSETAQATKHFNAEWRTVANPVFKAVVDDKVIYRLLISDEWSPKIVLPEDYAKLTWKRKDLDKYYAVSLVEIGISKIGLSPDTKFDAGDGYAMPPPGSSVLFKCKPENTGLFRSQILEVYITLK